MSESEGQAAGGSFDPATLGIMPESDVTRLQLLRHGDVVRFKKRVVRGQLDVPLSDEGLRQSRLLCEWITSREPAPDRLLSSDLIRCRRLGELLAEAWRVPLECRSELREQDMGEWQGLTWEEITERDPERVTAYWQEYVATRPPGGESLADLSERARRFGEELLSRHRGGRVVCVTHVGVIRALLCHLLDHPIAAALRFAPATASHTQLVISAPGAVLESLGERPWTFVPP